MTLRGSLDGIIPGKGLLPVSRSSHLCDRDIPDTTSLGGRESSLIWVHDH